MSIGSIIRHVCVQAWPIAELVKLVSKEVEGAARPTEGYQHCPQYVSHRVAVVALRLESHHSPIKCNSKHARADRRCSATVTEIEHFQILRKIELWIDFLHFNIVHSKQHVALILTKTPTTCTFKARKIQTHNISSYMFRRSTAIITE